MERVIELPENLNKICRTCLNVSTDEEYESALFENGKSTQLCVILSVLMNEEISSDDRLPQRMCGDCCELIKLFEAFKTQRENIEGSLKQLFVNNLGQFQLELYDEKNFADYSCDECTENFKSLYELKKHLVGHNKNKSLTERYCAQQNIDSCVIECEMGDESQSLIEARKDVIQAKKVKKSKLNNTNDDDVGGDSVLEENHKTHFTCDLCDAQFTNNLVFTLHFLKHATIIQGDSEHFREHYIFCNYCGLTCENNNLLDEHVLEKHPDESDSKMDIPATQLFVGTEKNIYSCPLCAETFEEQEALHKHSLMHLIRKFKCHLCKVFYISEMSLNEHLKMHPTYKHVCKICGKRLGSRPSLRSHMQLTHTIAPTLTCDVCHKGFKNKVRLNFHKRRHGEEKKFVCMYCGYCTDSSGDLKVHNRVHTSERPYKCTYSNCAKTFKTSSHLAEHARRHLQIRRFKCDICESLFSHTNSLKRHMMFHTGDRPFQCNFCQNKFNTRYHLKVHMRKHEFVL